MAYGDGRELDRLETALEAAGIAWWWMELPSGVVFYSPNKTRMLKRDSADFYHYKHFVDVVHKDDQTSIMDAMQRHIEGKTDIYEAVYRIKVRGGSYKTFYDRGKIVGRKDGEMVIAGFVMDVSALRGGILHEALAKE